MLAVPEVAFVPLQPFEAVHEVALVEDQVSVLLPPLATCVGDALRLTVGAGVVELRTVTVALLCAVPPVPVHASVNVVLAVNAPVLVLPEVPFAPLQPPEAVHDVAFVVDHVSVLDPPLSIRLGDADRDTVGAGGPEPWTVTVTLACAEPPEPVHVSVNVALVSMPPVLSVPDVERFPLQPPDATHDEAFVDDHLSVLAQPGCNDSGLAESVTVGTSAARDSALPPAHVPSVPMSVSSAKRMVVFMGGDDRRNVVGTVCLQTATC